MTLANDGFSSLQKASGKFVQNEFSFGGSEPDIPPLKHSVGFLCKGGELK